MNGSTETIPFCAKNTEPFAQGVCSSATPTALVYRQSFLVREALSMDSHTLKGVRVYTGRMAVLLVCALNRNPNPDLNLNPNPLTAGCRPHIRPVPHEYDQRTCCVSSPPASRQYAPVSLFPALPGQASFWPQAHPDTPRIPTPSRRQCQRQCNSACMPESRL